MVHFIFFLYTLSFATAAASITGAILLYLHYRMRVLLFYSAMLAIPTLLLIQRMVEFYSSSIPMSHPAWSALAQALFEKAAFVSGMFIGPLFLHHLLGLEISKIRRWLYLAAAA